ncbi:MAG: hypothetical protein N2381_06095 [Armatimonadetes bacterium]|nr:hypothetical protein [Armatimonadota bacterium]
MCPASTGQDLMLRDSHDSAQKRLTFATLMMTFAGIVAIAIVMPYADLVLEQRLTSAHLSSSALTLLLLALAFRKLLSRWRFNFPCSDLLLAYSVWHFCSALPSSGFGGFLFPMMATFHYFSTPANQWQELFGSFIPPWFAVSDLAAVRSFYEGVPASSSLQFWAWAFPASFWLIFATIYFASLLCLALWLHSHWIVDEKLSFPTVQVVQSVVMPNNRRSLFPLLCGIMLPILVHSLNGLAKHFPSLPSLPLQFAWGKAFVDFPFDVWQGERTVFNFASLGIGFIIPAEVALSFWGFYLVHLLVRLILRWRGFAPGVGTGGITTLQRAQEAGGFLILAAVLLMPALRKTMSRGRNWARTQIHLPILWVSLTLVLILLLCLSGMRFLTAVALFAVWTAVHLVLTRAVSAGGIMNVECSFMPWDIIARTVGVHRVGWRDLTVMAFPQQLFMFDQVTIPLPYLMDGFKMAISSPFPIRLFVLNLAFGYFATIAISLPFTFWLCHRWGALNLNAWFTQQEPSWAFHKLRSWMAAPFGVDMPFVQNMLIGATVMAFLLYFHRHFLWWNISPLGFVMSSTSTLQSHWFSLFFGWLLRGLSLRFAGLEGYQSFRPFFIGCIWGGLVANAVLVLTDFMLR